MVFFNYATMQMAAKIVYYGPGLCGKTTNLHFIYSRTSPGSRGEMVSLETETDRTLFFDLLPLDVGVIGGFKTRVQLYTVPGQVFYNTTRKLVLKGVDGIVFVADSQKAMKEANVESLNNLRVNLAEIGLQLDDLPLVFQFNKRDLSNTSTVEELNQSLNPQGRHESYEASAVLGQGVFETLKAISKLTLRSLKKRMLGEDRPARAGAGASTAPMPAVAEALVEPAMPLPEPAATSVPHAAPQEAPKQISLRDFAVAPQHHQPPPVEQPHESPPRPFEPPKPPPPPVLHGSDAFDAGDVETVQEFEQALNSLDAPLPEPEELTEEVEIGDVSFAKAPEPEEVAPEDVKHVRVRSNIDILAELEKLRKNATAAPLTPKPTRRATEGISIDDLLASSLNHRKEINRVFELEVPRGELKRGHQVSIDLRLEDKDKKTVGEEKSFSIELHSRSDIEKLLLSLKFHIQGK